MSCRQASSRAARAANEPPREPRLCPSLKPKNESSSCHLARPTPQHPSGRHFFQARRQTITWARAHNVKHRPDPKAPLPVDPGKAKSLRTYKEIRRTDLLIAGFLAWFVVAGRAEACQLLKSKCRVREPGVCGREKEATTLCCLLGRGGSFLRNQPSEGVG
jgi:hypothetical protein